MERAIACGFKSQVIGTCALFYPDNGCLMFDSDAYQSIMETCTSNTSFRSSHCNCPSSDRPGDKIFVFGFSRGAYTVLVLAAMLHAVGLLPPHFRKATVKKAYKIYMKASTGQDQTACFKHSHQCINVEIEFMGLW